MIVSTAARFRLKEPVLEVVDGVGAAIEERRLEFRMLDDARFKTWRMDRRSGSFLDEGVSPEVVSMPMGRDNRDDLRVELILHGPEHPPGDRVIQAGIDDHHSPRIDSDHAHVGAARDEAHPVR